MYEDTSLAEPPKKRGLSSGAKIGIGCGVTALLLILICAGVLYFTVRYFIREAEAFAADLESRGYTRVAGQVIQVTQPVDQPTVYFGQSIQINAPAHSDIAIIGQTGDIFMLVDGDVDFYGQVLTIHPNAVITGDLRIKGAQAVNVLGSVQGQVSGSYQTIQQPLKPPAPAVTPPDAPSTSPAPEVEPAESQTP